MELLRIVHESEAACRLGWTLLHTLWQGAAVALLLALTLWILRRSSSDARYLAGCLAMAVMVALPVATFFLGPAPVKSWRIDEPLSGVEGPSDATPQAHQGRPTGGPIAGPGGTPLPFETGKSLPTPSAANDSVVDATGLALPARVAQVLEPALPWLVLAWSAGVLLLSLRQVWGWIAVKRLKRLAIEPEERGLVETVAEVARAVRVSRPVKVLESMLVRVPTLIGWLRPVILLPVGLATGLTPEQLQAILAHELAHVRRYDYLVNLLQSLVETLLFYHPAVWYMAGRIRAERENCCDDVAVAAGAERVAYAELLLCLAQRSLTVRQGWQAAAGAALATTGAPSQLRRRISRLTGRGAERTTRFSRGWPIALAFLGAIVMAAYLIVNIKAEPPPQAATALKQPLQRVSSAEEIDICAQKYARPEPKPPEGLGLPKFHADKPLFFPWKLHPDSPAGKAVRDATVWVALDSSGNDGVYDLLHIDSNVNGSLADEPAIKGEIERTTPPSASLGMSITSPIAERSVTSNSPVPGSPSSVPRLSRFSLVRVRLPGPNGPVDYHVNVCLEYRRDGPVVRYWAADTYEGRVTIDGKAVWCTLLDENSNGTFNDVAMTPWDADRIRIGPPLQRAYLHMHIDDHCIGRYVGIEGRLYTLEAASDGAYVILAPATDAPMGTIRAEGVDEVDLGGQPGQFRCRLKEGGASVPAGEYVVDRATTSRIDDQGLVWKLIRVPQQSIRVAKGQEVDLGPAELPVAQPRVEPQGVGYRINLALTDTKGTPFGLTYEGAYSLAAKVHIANADGSYHNALSMKPYSIYGKRREVVGGGWGKSSEVVWQQPSRVKGPFTVTIELPGPFKIEAKPCTIETLRPGDKGRESPIGPTSPPATEGVEKEEPKPVRIEPKPFLAPAPARPFVEPGAKGASQDGAAWVVLLPKSPIRSINEYHQTLRTHPDPVPPLFRPVPVPDCDLEIRRAKDQARIARIPYQDYLRSTNELSEPDRRRIGPLGDGQYLVALCVGTARISNVAVFEMNSGYETPKERGLRLVPIEPGPGLESHFLGVRGTGPTPGDPQFGTWSVHCPDLVVDGTVRKVDGVAGSFLDMPPGVQFDSIVDLRTYSPSIALGEPHAVKAAYKQYESDIVQLPAPLNAGLAWDGATGKLPPVPEPHVVLFGTVIDPEGKPAKRFEVALSRDGGRNRFREKTGDAGRYEFINVPSGTYHLGCNPPAKGQPCLEIKGVAIQAGKTLQRDLSLERKSIIAGRITGTDGKPASNTTVDLSCADSRVNAAFTDTTSTDNQGRYELGSPFGEVTYIGIKGRRVEGSMPILQPGVNQAHYSLRQVRGEVRAVPDAGPAGGALGARGRDDTATIMSIARGLPTRYRLGGHVVDPNGQPVGGADVILVEGIRRRPRPSPKIITVQTDAAGKFQFPPLEPLPSESRISWQLYARKKGAALWGKELDSTGGETDVAIQLPPPAKIAGRVVDQDGRPIGGALASLRSYSGSACTWSLDPADRIGGAGVTNEDGAFVIDDAPAGGVVSLLVGCAGYETVIVGPIDTGREKTASSPDAGRPARYKVGELVTVALRRGATLRGIAVYEGTGNAAAGIRIATQAHKTAQWSEAVTGPDGRFELADVAPESCNLLAVLDPPRHDETPEWTAAAIEVLHLKPGELRDGLKITLTKGGVLKGKVTDAAGRPLKGIDIAFYSAARPRSGGACQSVLTRADGTWAYRFPEGPVHVYIRERDLGSWERETYDLAVKAGETAENVDFKLATEVAPTSPASGSVPQAAFGQVIERTVNDMDEGKGNEAIDLDMGKVFSLPAEFGRWAPAG